MSSYTPEKFTAFEPKKKSPTLPETNIFAPENVWLEYDCFLLRVPAYV